MLSYIVNAQEELAIRSPLLSRVLKSHLCWQDASLCANTCCISLLTPVCSPESMLNGQMWWCVSVILALLLTCEPVPLSNNIKRDLFQQGERKEVPRSCTLTFFRHSVWACIHSPLYNNKLCLFANLNFPIVYSFTRHHQCIVLPCLASH